MAADFSSIWEECSALDSVPFICFKIFTLPLDDLGLQGICHTNTSIVSSGNNNSTFCFVKEVEGQMRCNLEPETSKYI